MTSYEISPTLTLISQKRHREVKSFSQSIEQKSDVGSLTPEPSFSTVHLFCSLNEKESQLKLSYLHEANWVKNCVMGGK